MWIKQKDTLGKEVESELASFSNVSISAEREGGRLAHISLV